MQSSTTGWLMYRAVEDVIGCFCTRKIARKLVRRKVLIAGNEEWFFIAADLEAVLKMGKDFIL